jgi:RND family efflux transporter MFP subunit
VTVAQPETHSVTDWYEFTGSTEASEYVEIRARVEGYLETVTSDAGALIKEGDLLFQIDPKPYEARLKGAEAMLESAQATARRAKHDFERIAKLYKDQVAADTEYINAEADWKMADAAIKAAEAQVATAQLNLGYTTIKSPIDG